MLYAPRHALRGLWERQSGGAPLLRPVRRRARRRLPCLRRRQRACRPVLRELRRPARGGRSSAAADDRAADGVGALRRPGGVHGPLRPARSRGGARAPDRLLRRRPPRGRAPRRHGREVHRRRRHGRLGSARRTGGRRRAGRAGGARARRRRARPRRPHRHRSRRPGGRRQRRCGGDGGRGRPGDRGRRPGEHRVPDPGGGGAGGGAGRRGDPADDRGGDRVRAGRQLRAQGQARAGGPVAGGARVGGAAGRRQKRRARPAVRRPGARAAPVEGHLPRHRGRAGAPRRRVRDRGYRQVAPGLGVREVRGRPRRRGALASRPLPLLRRGGRVLGAGRDGAHARPHRRGRAGHDCRRRSSRRSSTSGSPTPPTATG